MRKLLLYFILLIVILSGCNFKQEKNQQLNSTEETKTEQNNNQENENTKKESNINNNQQNTLKNEDSNSELLEDNISDINKENEVDLENIEDNQTIQVNYEYDPKYGNTTGNINNMGYAATDGEWIYFYKDYYDSQGQRYSSKYGELYRVQINGEKEELVSENEPIYINVKGDWVYYVKDEDVFAGPIYKVKKDGSEEIKLTDDTSRYLTVVDNWIFYINESDENRIYKMKIDGSENTKFINDFSYNINVLDNWIYYLSNGIIYKIDIDGHSKTIIYEDEIFEVDDMVIQDNWIYIMAEENGLKKGIYKMRTDGTEITKISNNIARSLNIKEDWLYYTVLDDKADEIYMYRTKTDGTAEQKLEVGDVGSIIGNWLYYRQLPSDQYPLHLRVDINSFNEK